MPDALPVGPYRILNAPGGLQIPYYIVTFDKEGRCTSPQTRAHLLEHVGDRSDIFLFSHGWNNDWTVATKRYESFIEGFMQMRQAQGLATPPGYAPMLVGIFWPSAVLVGEDEQGPQIAGSDAASDAAVADERAAVAEIAERLPAGSVERFYELAQRDALTADEALELARILLPIYKDGESELASGAPTADELVAGWRAASPDPDADADPDDFGTATPTTGGGPQAAGFLGTIRDLGRNAIRGTTVWMMKDRAGRVGAKGVSPLLVDLLQGSTARIHLIGHSYGGKVVLSALCAPDSLPRKASSLLLLQPAVSHLCFADKVPVRNVPGGYRTALERVARPILTTFSSRDVPLTKAFHLAVVRPSDLGEIKIAAAGDPPNWFAALGGFGPRRAGEQLIDMRLPPSAYTLDPAARIYGLRGDATISGHGDISNPSTWWALHTLVRR